MPDRVESSGEVDESQNGAFRRLGLVEAVSDALGHSHDLVLSGAHGSEACLEPAGFSLFFQEVNQAVLEHAFQSLTQAGSQADRSMGTYHLRVLPLF